MPDDSRRRAFGTVAKLPSGRYRARYRHQDQKHSAPTTFEDKETAQLWLRNERRAIEEDPLGWIPPAERARAAEAARRRRGVTFGAYAEAWLKGRRTRGGRPLSPTTQRLYRRILDEHLLPEFGDTTLTAIEPDDVDAWHELVLPHAPRMRAHCYALLRTILGTAVERGMITTGNPAKIRGAGSSERRHQIEPATLDELAVIVSNMPAAHRLLVLLGAWCALRYGEATELRRSDVLTAKGVIRVRRGVVWVGGRPTVKDPKTRAGSRDVAIPPHLMPLVREHLLQHAQPGADGLLFPAPNGGHLSPATFKGVAAGDGVRKPKTGHGYFHARSVAGRPDLRFHDLRHTGAVLAAATGATMAELMSRLGHTTVGAAMRYQHAARDRDAEIAALLSKMVQTEGQA